MPPENEEAPGFLHSLAVDQLIELHRFQSAAIRSQLRRDFSGTCLSRVEDAIQAAALAMLERPLRFQDAWIDGGDQAVGRLYHTIAWRHLRGEHRRRSHRNEVGWPETEDGEFGSVLGEDPTQEISVDLQLHIDKLLAKACEVAPEASAEDVIAALAEKLRTGDPDTQVALRTGVRREYLNRAKRRLRRLLREEMGVG